MLNNIVNFYTHNNINIKTNLRKKSNMGKKFIELVVIILREPQLNKKNKQKF